MSRSNSQRDNTVNLRRKIQDQFNTRMKEKTPSGAYPSSSNVIKCLADDWCKSPHTIEAIVRMQIDQN